MQSSQLCLCTLEKKHEKEVAFLLKEFATTEALSKFMKLTDEDKNILNQTYSMVNQYCTFLHVWEKPNV